MDLKEVLNDFMLSRCLFTKNTVAQDIFINYNKENIFHTIHNGEFCILEKVDTSKGAPKNIVQCYEMLGKTPEEFKVYKIAKFNNDLFPKTKHSDKTALIQQYSITQEEFESICNELQIYACRDKIDALYDNEIIQNEDMIDLIKSIEYEEIGTISLTKEDIVNDIIFAIDNRVFYNVTSKNNDVYKNMAALRAMYA